MHLPILLLVTLPLLAQVSAPLGKLVDIGGRKLHIHCTGSGAPTVILESGASSFAIDWSLVQPEIAKTNRVCSYDRARMGWSEPGSLDTADNIVRDLRALLRAANEKGPYVLVGASMGGIYVRVFQRRHPEDVLGIVLVDPVHESRLFTRIDGQVLPIASVTAEQYRKAMPQGDVPIPRRGVQTGEPFSRLPEALYKTRMELDQKLIDSYPPTVGAGVVAERSEAERVILKELEDARTKSPNSLGKLPLVILTRGVDTNAERNAGYAEMAKMSTRSRYTIVADAGHEIHLFRPTVVIEAIREVIALAGSK